MFFVASKILYFLITPIFWILVLFAIALFIKKPNIKRNYIIAGILTLIFFSNQFFFNFFCKAWEVNAPIASQIRGHYKYGVVLGGMATADKYDGKKQFSASVDRLLEVLVLYKNGQIEKIVLSGGSGAMVHNKIKEAPILRNLCISLGIPDSAIIEEPMSRNTHENAVYTKDLIGTDSKILLSTSAFHMRRSMGCFKKEGFKFDTVYTDPMEKFKLAPDDYFLPKAEVLFNWATLIKEWIGCVAYWIAGYI
jgi:uncharacterized SAM-binding protein YcdF (DUF218 family)